MTVAASKAKRTALSQEAADCAPRQQCAIAGGSWTISHRELPRAPHTFDGPIFFSHMRYPPSAILRTWYLAATRVGLICHRCQPNWQKPVTLLMAFCMHTYNPLLCQPTVKSIRHLVCTRRFAADVKSSLPREWNFQIVPNIRS
jgi:hypothetical protein